MRKSTITEDKKKKWWNGILFEKDDFDYPRVRRLIARNASSMTELEKKELINALFGEE